MVLSPPYLRHYRGEMPDLLEKLVLAGQRITEAQQKEEAARALYDANQTPENQKAWNECRSETDRLFWEHQRLMQQLKQGATDSAGS